MGGDALAGLEEEVVEEELLVERSKPPPPPPPPTPPLPLPLLLCLMPLSSMAWPPPPPPPVTSFHNCWSSAGLRPAGGIKELRRKKRREKKGTIKLRANPNSLTLILPLVLVPQNGATRGCD